MYKKLLLLLLVLFTIGGLVGCDETITPPAEDPNTEEPTPEDPDTEDPDTEDPDTEDPDTEDPDTEDPDTEEPIEDNYYDDYIDLLEVHAMSVNTQLEVSGVVYFMTQNGYYIQDDTYNLFIFTDQTPEVNLGERVVVSGKLTTYRSVKQIADPVLVEVNATDLSINQDTQTYDFSSTTLEPGHIYELTGEVRIEGSYNTTFLYEGDTKIAEIYYRSISHSINAINTYEGEIITLNLLYYAEGDDVPRFAFQGSSAHISVYMPDQSVAVVEDAESLPKDKTLYDDFDFGQGFYGSTYEITNISGDAIFFIDYIGSKLIITKPTEAEGDQTGTVTIKVSLGTETPITKTINIIVKASGSTTIDMTYYESAIGLTGDDLFYELNNIINQNVGSMSYDYAKTILEESDRDPNNPNNVILVYTRESVKGQWDYPNWNREHVWPQSKLMGAAKGDAHNLKPSDVQENSRRGNLPFGYASSGVYEPHDDAKGDIARIVFYMATMNTQLTINASTIGDLDILLDWHQMDPVDDFERNRNNVIHSYQGNRNPYIDYPQFVNEIWGDGPTETESPDAHEPTGYRLLQDELETIGIPATGDVKVLVFAIDFPDSKINENSPTIDEIDQAFNGLSDDLAFESLNSYYVKSSYGKLNITADVFGYYTVSQTSTYYNEENEKFYSDDPISGDYTYVESDIIDELLTYYDQDINYADYDSNNDGYIDGIYLVYNHPTSDSNLWWAYQYYYYNESTYDGVTPNYYTWGSNDFIINLNGEIDAKVFIHETGHMLGLDDYYDYYTEDLKNEGGLGTYMMDFNEGDHDPFSKILLGWITPTVVESSAQIRLLPNITSGDVILVIDQWNNTIFDEYILITYYKPIDLNSSDLEVMFSTSGINMFHISAQIDRGYSENTRYYSMFNYNNTDTIHKLIDIIEADMNESIEATGWIENSDLFQVGDSLNDNVYPDYTWYNSTDLGYIITVLSIEENYAIIQIETN